MGRVKGTLISTTYEPGKRQPLDARALVTKKADLINPTIWTPTGATNTICYNGQITAVNGDGDKNGIYYLIDRTAITEDNYNAYIAAGTEEGFFSMWIKLWDLDDANPIMERIAALEKADEQVGEMIAAEVDKQLEEADYLTSEDFTTMIISGGTADSI